jgi:threonine dehydratase
MRQWKPLPTVSRSKSRKVTFPIIQKYVDEIVEVTEDEIARAIFSALKTIVSSSKAQARRDLRRCWQKNQINSDDTVCAVLCGGNIDPNLLARVLEQVLVRQGRYILFKLLGT